MTDHKPDEALENLSAVNGQTSRVITTVVAGSVSIARQNSTVVSGVFGGFSGLTVAYLATSLVASSVATLSFPILGPLLTGLGIAAGVLTFRRSSILPAEADAARRQIAIDENERVAKILLMRIRNLPRSAPKNVRDELWIEYAAISKDLPRLAAPVGRPPLTLPAPATPAADPAADA